jgi:hypothetical protein
VYCTQTPVRLEADAPDMRLTDSRSPRSLRRYNVLDTFSMPDPGLASEALTESLRGTVSFPGAGQREPPIGPQEMEDLDLRVPPCAPRAIVHVLSVNSFCT